MRWYFFGNEFFKGGFFGMKMKMVVSFENGSISFCGSFIVGSFIVVCISSFENLYVSGGFVFCSSLVFSGILYYL